MPTGTYTEEVVCVQRTGTLYDALELILDRGMVIDVFIRVSLVGIEILKIDARIVVASVDTYLRFAEACNRVDLEFDRSKTVPELLGGMSGGGSPAGRVAAGVGKKKAKKAVEGVGEKVKRAVGADDDEEDEEREEPEEQESRPRRRTAVTGARSRRRPAPSEED